jgi:hypothetical protein
MQQRRLFITEANEYRAYIVGPDGHIQRRIDLFCADDDEAKERAKAMVDGHAIELWQEARKVVQFDAGQ